MPAGTASEDQNTSMCEIRWPYESAFVNMRTILVVSPKAMTLNDLNTEACGIIEAIHSSQELRRRLCGLGLRSGMRVRVMRRSPLNGPMQVRVGHTDLILRRADAAHIEVRPA